MKRLSSRERLLFNGSEKAILKQEGFQNYDPKNPEYNFFGRSIIVRMPSLSPEALSAALEQSHGHVDYRGDKTAIPNELVEIKVDIERPTLNDEIGIETFVSFGDYRYEDGEITRHSASEGFVTLSIDLPLNTPIEKVIAHADRLLSDTRKQVMGNAAKMQESLLRIIREDAGLGE